jgi:hypothetical protein
LVNSVPVRIIILDLSRDPYFCTVSHKNMEDAMPVSSPFGEPRLAPANNPAHDIKKL